MLIGQLGYRTDEAQVAERLAAMHSPSVQAFVALLDDAVAGCLTTSIMRVLHRPAPVGRISMLVVDEGLRGRGIGAALIAAAEAALSATGCGLVEVTSNLRLAEAHRFYERLGYSRTSIRFARELSAPAACP